jgi:predicted MPP superfamily phosphohydrolase
MDRSRLIVFLSIVLGIWALASLYVCRRASLGLPQGWMRATFVWAFLLLTLAYPASRFLERLAHGPIASAGVDLALYAGSVWMAVFVYLLMAVLAWDLARALGLLPPLARLWPVSAWAAAWRAVFPWVGLGVLLVVAAGWVNAGNPCLHVLTLDLDAARPKGAPKEVRLALVTDIHLGHVLGKPSVERLHSLLKEFDPDVVVLGGDMVDEDLAPVIAQDLGAKLGSLPSREGVWAVTGNHEFIGGVDEACAYLAQHGVRLLRDQSTTLPCGLVLVGREDKSAGRFGPGKRRLTVAQLVAGLDPKAPKVLIDHQPPRAAEFQGQGIDLVLSGHTHNGQLWPFQWITGKIFEHSIGLRRIGRAWQYISPGFGTWGPPVRTNARPEVAGFVLRYK